jgi:mannitol/fructose-specific phosphotransferase system IIA component (Ntr-type)
MELREFFSEDVVKLDLESTSKDEVLKEMIQLLGSRREIGKHSVQDVEAA